MRMKATQQMFVLPQESRKALKCADEFKFVCLDILNSMRSRDMQHEDDMSVGTQLLRIVDPSTGVTSIDLTNSNNLICRPIQASFDIVGP